MLSAGKTSCELFCWYDMNKTHSRVRAYDWLDPVLLFLIAIVWSMSFLLMKWAHHGFGALSIAAYRCLFGFVVLWLLGRGGQWLAKRHEPIPLWGRWGYFTVLLISSYLWPYFIQAYLVTRVGSGFVGMSIAFVPIFTVFWERVIRGGRTRLRELLILLLGLFMMLLLYREQWQTLPHVPLLFLCATVPFSYALGNTWNRHYFGQASPLVISTWSMGIAGALLLPLAVAFEGHVFPKAAFGAWGALFVLGAVGTGLAVWAFYIVIYRRGPVYASYVLYLIPLGATLAGHLSGERYHVMQWLLIALIPVIVVSGLRQHHDSEPVDDVTEGVGG